MINKVYILSIVFISLLKFSGSAQRCGSDLSFRILDKGIIYPLIEDTTYQFGIENKLIYEKLKLEIVKIEGNSGKGRVDLNVRKNYFSIKTGCGINHLELKITLDKKEMLLNFDSLHGDIDFIADSLSFSTTTHFYNGNVLFDSIKKTNPKALQPFYFDSQVQKLEGSKVESFQKEVILGHYKNQYSDCRDFVIKKNGKFYYPEFKNLKKRNGKWEITGGLLHLTCEYEIYKENKNKKITNFEFPAYQKIKESKYFQINEKELIEVYETGVPVKSKCSNYILAK